ncbi:MAG: hypothetical protein V4709_11480 [Pseudomonadota bacterium]
MASSAPSPNARRLRWALLIALALHAVLLWRYAPNLFERFESVRKADPSQPEAPRLEEIVEITPPPEPPRSRGMVLSTRLGSGSPETLQAPLPKGFFAKPAPIGSGLLHLADDLDFARASGAQIVANIIPAATRLPNISALSDKARTPKPVQKPKPAPAPAPAPLRSAQAPVSVAAAGEPPPAPAEPPQVPFLLPPVLEDLNVDAAIARAANTAQQSARAANTAAPKPAPDYRALLPQGPLVAAPPLPLGSKTSPQPSPRDSGITTFALDAPAAADQVRAAPDQGKAGAAARQQFFSLLTARLKATNQRLLAEAVKAGPRTTVRMKFLLDREGRVLEISPAEPSNRPLVERAAAVIRATPLPRVPDSMTQVPVELSFPVEVYR